MRAACLIDTDWVIDHFNKVERTTQKLKELKSAGIAMCVISLAELYEGVFYSRIPAEANGCWNIPSGNPGPQN